MYRINKLQHGKRFERDFLQHFVIQKKYFPRRCTEWSKVHLFRITGKLLVISWQNYGENHKPQGRGQEAEKSWGEGDRAISGVPRGDNRKEGNCWSRGHQYLRGPTSGTTRAQEKRLTIKCHFDQIFISLFLKRSTKNSITERKGCLPFANTSISSGDI